MTKPRVFISHSCKDSQTDPSEAVAYARRVRELVMRKLEPDFEVWLDQTGLEPGDTWRAKLHRWLNTCDAAVILLDKESVRSRWLLKEATILAWRRDLGARVRLVPALLGDFTRDDVADSPLAAIELETSQFARIGETDRSEASAEALAHEIVSGLADTRRTSPSTPMEEWVDEVREILTEVRPVRHLARAADRLGMEPKDWDSADLAAAVAHELLHTAFDNALEALAEIHGRILRHRFRELAALVRPVWVEAEAGQSLNALVSRDPRPIAVLAAREFQTAHDHVRRARFCRVKSEWIVPVQLPTGADPSREADANFLEAMSIRLGHPGNVGIVKSALKSSSWFVVLGPEPLPTAAIQKLHRTYEGVRFIVLRDGKHAAAFAADLGGRLVEPVASAETETEAHGKFVQIEVLT